MSDRSQQHSYERTQEWSISQITVFSEPERRRRWSDEERLQILTEAFAPGACACDVARRHEISTRLLYTWRKKLAAQAPPATENPSGEGRDGVSCL